MLDATVENTGLPLHVHVSFVISCSNRTYPWWLLTNSSDIATTDISCGRITISLQWRHNERVGVSNHQPQDCLLNRLFRHRSKKTSKSRATGLCEGNSPVIGEFPAQRTSNAENFPFDDVIISYGRNHGPVSISDKTDYRDILQRLEPLGQGVKMLKPLLNLSGDSEAMLPRCLPNSRAIGKL